MSKRKTGIDWSSSEAAFTKEKFRETKNYGFVALEIGIYPENPAPWAMDACRKLAEELAKKKPEDLTIDDYKTAAVAIGMQPNDPPEWAITVCRKLHQKIEIANQPVLGPTRLGANPTGDDHLLEAMADLLAKGTDMTVHKAAHEIAEKFCPPNIDLKSTMRRLQRKWKKEERMLEFAEGDSERFHPRLDRAFARLYSYRAFTPKRRSISRA